MSFNPSPNPSRLGRNDGSIRTLGQDLLSGDFLSFVYSHDTKTDGTPIGPYLLTGPFNPVYWPVDRGDGGVGVREVLVGVISLNNLAPAKFNLATLLDDQRTQINEKELTTDQRSLLITHKIIYS